MRLFYDCEFLEDGRAIELISIGMVTDDGREYYAVNGEAPWGRISTHWWLCENVVPHLPLVRDKTVRSPASSHKWPFDIDTSKTVVKPRRVIGNEVRDFIQSVPDAELWAWYGAYDHVVLCQLWGRMIDLPDGVPMWTNDVKQECVRLGNPPMPQQGAGEHNALADARQVKVMAEHLDAFAARLSKLLFDARESIDALADIVEARTGERDEFDRRLVADIDAYRAEQGWNPNGFGGETDESA